MKSQFLDNKLRFNVAAFQSKYKDIQINVQSDPTNVRITDVLNAGKATVKGIEADLTLAPVRELRFTINYAISTRNMTRLSTPRAPTSRPISASPTRRNTRWGWTSTMICRRRRSVHFRPM